MCPTRPASIGSLPNSIVYKAQLLQEFRTEFDGWSSSKRVRSQNDGLPAAYPQTSVKSPHDDQLSGDVSQTAPLIQLFHNLKFNLKVCAWKFKAFWIWMQNSALKALCRHFTDASPHCPTAPDRCTVRIAHTSPPGSRTKRRSHCVSINAQSSVQADTAIVAAPTVLHAAVRRGVCNEKCVMSSIIFFAWHRTQWSKSELSAQAGRFPFGRTLHVAKFIHFSDCGDLSSSCLSSERAPRVKCTQTFSAEDGATISTSRQNRDH